MSSAYVPADTQVYRLPSPEVVARLISTHGYEAARERWHYIAGRTLSAMAQQWRASQGQASACKRTRSYSDLDAAVCVEAAHVLGSGTRGERAAGFPPNTNAANGIFAARGLKPVAVSATERGQLSRLGMAANRGDQEAIAERDARLAHELAVGRVLRVALSRIREQPRTGRYRLPPLGEALLEALAGEPEEAVAAVFPHPI